jgi:hypothetical protein
VRHGHDGPGAVKKTVKKPWRTRGKFFFPRGKKCRNWMFLSHFFVSVTAVASACFHLLEDIRPLCWPPSEEYREKSYVILFSNLYVVILVFFVFILLCRFFVYENASINFFAHYDWVLSRCICSWVVITLFFFSMTYILPLLLRFVVGKSSFCSFWQTLKYKQSSLR